MGFSNLSLVKPTTKSKLLQGGPLILEQLETHFGKIEVKADLKFIPSFILYICCMIEEAYSNKQSKGKIDKKTELLKIMEQFLQLTLNDQEKKVICEIVDDLHSSRRIKRASCLSKTFWYMTNFFLKGK